MKYRKVFDEVKSHLESLGLSPSEFQRGTISEEDVKGLEKEISTTLPNGFRNYLLEMGEFRLSCDVSSLVKEGYQSCSWGVDYRFEWFAKESAYMKEDMGEYAEGKSDLCKTSECQLEARRGCNWLPIMGEGNGGYRVCIDLAGGEIFSHDIRMSDGYHPTLKIAKDFDSFLLSWAVYSFSPFYSEDFYDNLEGWMWDRDGVLEWHDGLFHSSLKIPNHEGISSRSSQS